MAATLLLLAVGAEVATRLLTDTQPPLTVKDAVIGQRYVQSFEGEVYVPEANRKVLLRFNRAGFRGPDRPEKKPPGVRRVAVLGDSMIASVAVDEEDTLICRLEEMLNESHPQVKWEVLNFGVCGASPAQEMVLYRELASRWDPDIVLCAFFVGNDLADNCHRMSNAPRIYFDLDDAGDLQQLPFSVQRAKINQWLNRHSRFYVWQRGAVRRLRLSVMEKAGVVAPGYWIFCRRESEELAHAWKLSGTILREFRREVESRGARFAVVMIPEAAQVYDNYFRSVIEPAGELKDQFDRDYPQQRLGALCREAGVPLLSMTGEFRAAAPGASTKVKQEWLFLNGTGHFNEQGNEVAARAVHRFLTRGGREQVAGRPLVDRVVR